MSMNKDNYKKLLVEEFYHVLAQYYAQTPSEDHHLLKWGEEL